MAGLDVSKLPKMETSGRDCIRNVQEWMFSERSSKECAVLPEDTLQRILVGVSTLTLIKAIVPLISTFNILINVH